uniref:KEN domain-containing protein n=2 Tax=Oryza sativa subsp. japonica TaxID=39947 RepID=Q65WZ7_ORYSJ|nr:hypothetical protein [Oryza sativa Japonica Group]
MTSAAMTMAEEGRWGEGRKKRLALTTEWKQEMERPEEYFPWKGSNSIFDSNERPKDLNNKKLNAYTGTYTVADDYVLKVLIKKGPQLRLESYDLLSNFRHTNAILLLDYYTEAGNQHRLVFPEVDGSFSAWCEMAGKAALFDEQGRMTHLLKNMAATCHRAHELFHSVTLRLSKVTRCRPSVSRHPLRHLAAAGVGRKAADMGEEELGRRWEERARHSGVGRKSSPACAGEKLANVERSSAGLGGRARRLSPAWEGGARRCWEEELCWHGRKSSLAWEGGATGVGEEELAGVGKKELAIPVQGGTRQLVRGRSLPMWGGGASSSREEELAGMERRSSPASGGGALLASEEEPAGVGRSCQRWGGAPSTREGELAGIDLFDLVEQLHKVKLTLGNLDMDSIYVKNLDGSIKLLVLLTEERHSVAMDPITLGFSYFIKQEFCTSDKLRSYPDDWDDYRKGEFLMSLQNMHPRSLRELFKNVDGIGWPVKDKYLPKILSDIVEVDSLQGREHNLKDFSDYVNLLRNRYKHFNGLPDEVKAVLVNRKGLVKIISEWTPNFWIVVYERTGWPKTNLPGSLL